MILHLVNKATDSSKSLYECLQLLRPGQAVLLLEDAVYAAAGADASEILMQIKQRDCHCYLLQEDLAARGLINRITEDFRTVDFAGFVELCLEYRKVQSWS